MIRLLYRERSSGDPGTFVAREDGAVVLVVGEIRRTDVATPLPVVLPCWVMARGRRAPAYERAVFPMRRMAAESWEVLGVPLAAGDRETIYLQEVPELTGNHWARLAEAAAREDRRR